MIRKIVESVVASPVMLVSGVIVIVCVTVLVDRISSDTYTEESDAYQGRSSPVSGSEINQRASQPYARQTRNENSGSDTEVNNPIRNTNESKRSQHSSNRNNSKRKHNNPTGSEVGQVFDKNDNSESGINDTEVDPVSDGSNRSNNLLNFSQTSLPQNNTSSLDTGNEVVSESEEAASISDDQTEPDIPSDEPVDDPPEEKDPDEPGLACVTTVEHSVQIDLDETQTISCCPIVENGPACMCTLTTTDDTGTFVEQMNNCGN